MYTFLKICGTTIRDFLQNPNEKLKQCFFLVVDFFFVINQWSNGFFTLAKMRGIFLSNKFFLSGTPLSNDFFACYSNDSPFTH